MQIFNDIVQLSPEWFAVKLGKVSASHFSEVLRKEDLLAMKQTQAAQPRNVDIQNQAQLQQRTTKAGRKKYMFEVLSERLSGETHPSFNYKAMKDGVKKEPQARAYYEALYGTVEQVGFMQINDYVGCSPDGLTGTDGIIEIKCPYSSIHLSYIDKDEFPTTYEPQVQGNLWVTERQWCDFISFDPRIKARPFWKKRVFRNEKYIKVLSSAVDVFVKEMLELEAKITNKNLNF